MKDLKLSGYKGLYEQINENKDVVSEGKIDLVFVNGGQCSGKRKFVETLSRYGTENNLKVFAHKYNFVKSSQFTV